MKHVLALALALMLGSAVAAAEAKRRAPLTVLLQFDGDHSDVSLEEMKREVSNIMGLAGVSIDYRLRSELSSTDTPSDLVLIKFRGRCQMENLPPLMDERGPFAITNMTDGAVLPFSEVACDRVRDSIRRSMNGNELKRGDALLGRALGRVVAHELYHIVGKTPDHGKRGVAKTAMSGYQLIADELGFDPADIERLHKAH